MDQTQTEYVTKQYEFSKPLLYVIQAITGESTHSIVEWLLQQYEVYEVMHGLSSKEKVRMPSKYTYKNFTEYIFYKDTKVHIAMSTNIKRKFYWPCNPETRQIKFYFCNSTIKLDEQKIADIIAEGALLDISENVNAPSVVGTFTREQRRLEKEILKKQKQLGKEKTKEQKRQQLLKASLLNKRAKKNTQH